MRHDSVVSKYAIPTGILQVDGWSMKPPEIRVSHKAILCVLNKLILDMHQERNQRPLS